MIGSFLFAIAAVMTQRTVTPGATGPNRLDLDAAVLSIASPLRYTVSVDGNRRLYTLTGGLEDVRLHDANGGEHPYLLIAPPQQHPRWKVATILPVVSTKVTSGFQADLGQMIDVDRIRIDGIATPFLKRLRLEGSGDRMHWTILAPDATLFDLPEQQLKNLEIAFSPGSYRYLLVTWDDRSSARVTHVGSVSAEVHDASSAAVAVRLPVAFRAITSEEDKSRYRIALPGANLPLAAIELVVSNPNVYRDAAVTEPRLSGSTIEPFALGSSKLRRAERDNAVAEDLTIPISFPQGPDLELVVNNANNPPLSITAIIATFAPLPWVYFESADARSLTAEYGDASAKAPAYDLEARRAAAAATKAAEATWSAPAVVAAIPSVTNALPVDGAPIDRKDFRFTRSIGPTRPGLTSLVLDADVLAHSTELRDVRIVASNDHQVPYLLEHRGAPVTVPLIVPPRARGEGAYSVYRFALPYDSLPEGSRIVVTTTARVFDRTATLYRAADESHGRDRDVIQTLTWRSSDPAIFPPPLTFTAPRNTVRDLELKMDEGDNAPLPIVSAELELPSYALRFVSPGGPLTLVYGNASSGAPRYDLAILAPRLFGESARYISLTRAAPMIATREAGTERKVFWIVIALAVVALLVTLQRLLSSGVSTPS